jgi:hypothetical protein
LTFDGEAQITAPSGPSRRLPERASDKEPLVHRGRIIPVERDHLRARLSTLNHLERAGLDALDNGCGDGGSRFAREA